MSGTTARGEDPQARLTRLFEAHHGTVLAYASRRVGPAAAPDVAAETFAVAWRRVGAVPSDDAALPWLLATARHVLLAATRADVRRGSREVRAFDRSEPVATDEPDHALRAAELDVVRRALDRLTEPDRELLLLVAWDGLPIGQAAVVLGVSPGAARVRWLRARRRFADALGAVDGDPPPRRDPATPRPASPLTAPRSTVAEPTLGGPS